MNTLTDKLFAYGFHDTTVTDIRFEETKVILEFEEGLYTLDETGKETDLTGKAEMIICLDENKVKDSLDVVKAYEYIKCRIKPIGIKEVIDLKHGIDFELIDSYFSNFDNTFSLVNYSYSVEIKYCKDVEYRFETYQPGEIKERKEINELMKYRFHNSYLSHIAVKKDRVELTFPEGVCKVNGENNEVEQMNNFKLISYNDKEIVKWDYQQVYATRYGSGGEVWLNMKQIKRLLNRETIQIEKLWYSSIDRAIIINGIGRKNYVYEIKLDFCAYIKHETN